jgi:hypothetical protein
MSPFVFGCYAPSPSGPSPPGSIWWYFGFDGLARLLARGLSTLDLLGAGSLTLGSSANEPLSTGRIVFPLTIYATVSGTDGSNSRITHQGLGAFAGTVLSQLRARGGRSAHLRRLLGGNLPGLRHAAGNARGPRHRLIHGAAQHSAACRRGPSHGGPYKNRSALIPEERYLGESCEPESRRYIRRSPTF